MVPWREAWHDALYGPHGFYRGPRGRPGTSPPPPTGRSGRCSPTPWSPRRPRGRAPRRRRRLRPRRAAHRTWRRGVPTCGCTGVDVVAAPGRPAGCRGLAALPRRRRACPRAHRPRRRARHGARVARRRAVHRGRGRSTPGRLRVVLVDPATGQERLGGPRSPTRSWPGARGTGPSTAARATASRSAGPRRGLARPRRRGCATASLLAVDYGHTARWAAGGGRSRHTATGPSVAPGARRVVRPHRPRRDGLPRARRAHHQRAALRRSALRATTPPHELARTDPAGYLAALARRLGRRRADRPRRPRRLRLGAASRARGCDARGRSVAPLAWMRSRMLLTPFALAPWLAREPERLRVGRPPRRSSSP